jgi:thiamine phosphate synthase YjbQ (UPF0047 family)
VEASRLHLYEPGVVQDLKDAINRLAPQDLPHAHEAGNRIQAFFE